ncbi:MAG: hypothetical protein GY804_05685 [Alphaproteobacteria bacterium]|nr:hypothetical protein [Alphaproteobacteria bacterium]
MKKSSKALALVVAISLSLLASNRASAVPLPDIANGVIRFPEAILQALVNTQQLEEALSIEMTTFDYGAGRPGGLNMGATWGDFDADELIKSSDIMQSIMDGSYKDNSNWYVNGVGLGSGDWDANDIVDTTNTLYQLPTNPSDEEIAKIEANLNKGVIASVSSAFGLSVSLLNKYKYNMQSFLKYDDTLLTSDDTSVSKYYASLGNINSLTALAVLEGAQIRSKQTEAASVFNMYQHKKARVGDDLQKASERES